MQKTIGQDSGKKLRKRGAWQRKITAVLLAVFLVATPTLAYAAQSNSDIDSNIATRAALDSVVATQVDGVYGSIEGSISSYASDLVMGLVGNRDAIKALAKPILAETIKAQLDQANLSSDRVDELIDSSVDKVVDNQFVDKVLDNEFTQAVISRTVKYAAADIVAQLGIAADRDKVVASISDHIWNAGLKSVGTASTKVKSDLSIVAAAGGVVNTSYYDFSVVSWNSIFGIKTTPKEIKVSGWNTSNIKTYITGTVGLSSASKYNEYTQVLRNMDYKTVIWNAAKKALKDEIMYRLDKLYQDTKIKVLDCVEDKLAKVGVVVTINPADDFKKIAKDVEAAVKTKALQDTKLTLDALWKRLLS
jgi:hypothetical protein